MGKPFRLFERLEKLVMMVAVIAITLMMILISIDTFARYIFHSPISGTNEFVTIYLIVAIVFLGLSNTLKENEHISVNIIANKFSLRIKKVISIVTNVLGLLLFIFIFYQGCLVTLNAFLTNDSFIGVVIFPLFPAYGLVPLGCLLIIIRLVFQIIAILKNIELNEVSNTR
ncbi:TRAP transporter small permease [Sporosarcina sp. CAU 1771]